MRLLFLGTGTSMGVPMIGCPCEVCSSTDPKDTRFRSSLLVQNDKTILIDTTPDFRTQALTHKLKHLDAVVYTHRHNDHIMGFDDLRRFCEMSGQPLPIYGSHDTVDSLKKIFHYAFNPEVVISTYVRVIPHEIDACFSIGTTLFIPLPVEHGNTPTFGYLLQVDGRAKAAYIPDCSDMPDKTAKLLEDIPVLILDGLRDQPHPTHLHIDASIAVARKVGARKTYLTHVGHQVMHERKTRELPDGIALAHDGLVLDL